MKSNAVHRLRLVSVPEAVSFLVLLLCTLLKYTAGWQAGVKVLGPIHGVLFIVYVLFALVAWIRQRWSFRRAALILVLSVLPTGGFFADRTLGVEERGGAAGQEVAREPSRV